LIEADPNSVNETNRSGFTALHQAAHAGEEYVIEALLEGKANINAKCKDGCSPLMYASAQGFTEIIEQLYRAGADLTIQDLDGDTALAVGRNKKTKKLLTDLIAQGPPSTITLSLVAKADEGKEKETESLTAEVTNLTVSAETPGKTKE